MTVTLRPLTRDDLRTVMRLEEELFAPDTWSRAMYLEELGMTDTRYYLAAVDGAGAGGDEVVGYAGLIAYPDEAHVATIGVTTGRQGEGIGGMLLDALLAEADRRNPGGAAGGPRHGRGHPGAVRPPRFRAHRGPAELLPAERRGRGGDAT